VLPHPEPFVIVEAKGEGNAITYATAPLLFGRWSYEGVEVKDISLLAYLNVKTIKA
jgi:hypothetical protein